MPRDRRLWVLIAAAALGACSSTATGTVTTSIDTRDGREVLRITVSTTPETSVSVTGPGRSEGCEGPLDGTASYCSFVLDGVAERAPAYTISMTSARPRVLGVAVGSPGHGQQHLRVERSLGAMWSEERRRTVLLGTSGEIAVDAGGDLVLSGAPDGTVLGIGSQRAIVSGGEARLPLDVDPTIFAALVSTGGPPLVDIPHATIAAGGAAVPIAVRVDPATLRAGLVAWTRDVVRPSPELARGSALLWISSEGQTELHGEARTLSALRYVALERVRESPRGSCGPYSQTLSALGGARVARIARDLEVWIVDRSTGAEIARRRVPGPIPECPWSVAIDQRSVTGGLDLDAARAWLLATRPAA